MKKIFYFFAAALVLAAVGCSKDDVTSNNVQYVSDLKVDFEGGTRVSAEQIAAGLKFAFVDGEEIKVYAVDDTNVANIYVFDAASNVFKPKEGSSGLQVGKEYFAITHTDGDDAVSVDSEGNVTVNTDLGAHAGISNIPMITDVFTASEGIAIATMHHLVGVLEVPVKLNSRWASRGDILYEMGFPRSGMCGKFTAMPVAPYVKEITAAEEEVFSGELNVKLNTETATSVFIPILPGTYTRVNFIKAYYYAQVGENLFDLSTGTIEINKVNNQIVNRDLVIERGKITKITELSIIAGVLVE